MNSASSVISAAKVEHVAAMLSDSSALPGVLSVLEDFNSWATKTRSIRNLAEVTRAMSQATRSEIDYNVLRQHFPEQEGVLAAMAGSGSAQKEIMGAVVNFAHKALLHIQDKAGRAGATARARARARAARASRFVSARKQRDVFWQGRPISNEPNGLVANLVLLRALPHPVPRCHPKSFVHDLRC